MVKLKGPALSCGAHGSLADVLVFAENKGRNYAKKLTKPANPKSGGQVGVRAMMRFLATSFGDLSAADILTWADLATQLNASAYNAWTSYNLERWSRYLWPTKAFPANEDRGSGELQAASATALNRSIKTHVEMAEGNYNWGYHLCRSTSPGFDPAITTTIRIALWDMAVHSDIDWTDGPLEPGTYYYRVSSFSDDGFDENLFTDEFNATLT